MQFFKVCSADYLPVGESLRFDYDFSTDKDKKLLQTDQEKMCKVISNRNVNAYIRKFVIEPLNGYSFNYIPDEDIQVEVKYNYYE